MSGSAGDGLFGLALMLVLYFLIGAVASMMRLPRALKWLVWAGLALRLVGVMGREAIAADAHVYYDWGVLYAEYFARLDFAPLFDPGLWIRPAWMGTTFVGFFAGFVMVVIGASWFGTFMAFALVATIGIVAYGRAFRRSFPWANHTRYWAWILLFPSIWFWPSSIGKEAIMMMGLGLATLGYVGNGRRVNWLLLAVGTYFVFVIRAEVAALLILAVVMAYWVDFTHWTIGRFFQAVIMLAIGLAGAYFAMSTTEAGGLDPQSIEELVEYNAAQADQGGSAIGTTGTGIGAIPLAAVNVLFRPFLWEAHNPSALFSAVEMTLMWGIIWVRRRQLKNALKVWRRHRTLRFAVPFVLLYVVALGMNLANLGIIARQRTLVFPLLFLIVEAGSMFAPRPRWMRPPGALRRGRTPAPRPPRVPA